PVYSFFCCFGAHRDLPSFPTRRSSDLPAPPLRMRGRRWRRCVRCLRCVNSLRGSAARSPGSAVGVVLVVRLFVRLVDVTLVVVRDRKSTRLNSSHVEISYAVFCLKKKK